MPELEPLSEEEIKIDWLDGSKVSCFHLCPQKYFRRYEQHLQPITDSIQSYANAAQFGIAIHAGLASLYAGDGMEQDTCPCPGTECEFCRGRKIPRMVARFLINYPVDPDSDRDPRTRFNGLEILKQYVQEYLVKSREKFEVIGTELSFELEFKGANGEVDFHYVGRIDLLALQHETFSPWDHKTAASMTALWESGWKLSHAMTGYMVSTHQFTKLPCMEGTINGIQVKSRIGEECFKRITTQRSPQEIAEWEKEIRNVMFLIRHYRAQNFWPKHSPFACSAYFHLCEYYNLCCASGDKETEKNIIANNFEVVEWHPFHGTE